jgi:3-dehydroquinate synthase
MSDFTISHGAAVALGIALDVIYSVKCGLLSASAAERALALIGKLGFALFDPLMTRALPDGTPLLLGGLEEFREHLGGELTITLLREIGRGEEVHAIDADLMRASLVELERRVHAK